MVGGMHTCTHLSVEGGEGVDCNPSLTNSPLSLQVWGRREVESRGSVGLGGGDWDAG